MARWRREDVAPAGILHAAAAGDHGVAWACGILVQGGGNPFATLIFRRHGQGWEQVQAPQIGRVNRALAVSDADIWAVGDGCSLHWDGSTWEKVPTAGIQGSDPQFFGLAQFGADDVWTAGFAPMRGYEQARGTVQRWDGSAWADLPVPAVAASWSLSGIAGASPHDVWAAGRVHDGQRSDPLALHFDGQKWQRVPVPGVEGRSVQLSDIAVLGNGDAWAAGHTWDSGGIGNRQPFAVHWDGQAWTTGEVPEDPGQITQLASDGKKLWGLGYAAPRAPYVAALEGTSWQVIPGPPGPPGAHTALHGGTILSDGNLLAVGASSMPDASSRPFAAVLTSQL